MEGALEGDYLTVTVRVMVMVEPEGRVSAAVMLLSPLVSQPTATLVTRLAATGGVALVCQFPLLLKLYTGVPKLEGVQVPTTETNVVSVSKVSLIELLVRVAGALRLLVAVME